MVTTFLFLVPLVPVAALRWGDPEAGPSPARCEFESPLHPGCPPGAPAGPDAGGPTSPLSDRAVRAASRGWEWKALETPGWKILLSDNFALRGDVPVDDLRRAAAWLEEFLRMLRASIGGDPSGMRFSVRIFAEPADFRRYAVLAGAANAESFYDPRSLEVVICQDAARGRPALQRTLAHEFAHEYMDRVWGRTDPLWFAEGMAEYFANFATREGRVHAGAVDGPALRLLSEGPTVPLSRLVRLKRDVFYGEGFPLLYAQAWSFVHYLFSRKDGLIDLLLRGGSLEDLDVLEKGWQEHLKTLKRPS